MPKVKRIKKQSNLLAPTSCEGKYYFKEDFFQKVPKPETEKPSSNQAPQINPEDYVRTVTEGCVKPTLEDFLYTKDRNEKPNADFNWACDRYKEICGQPIVSDKKVYCKDCKHCWQYECKNIAEIVPVKDYHSQSYKIVYTLAHIENKDNNCKYYSEKWYIKLFTRWIIYLYPQYCVSDYLGEYICDNEKTKTKITYLATPIWPESYYYHKPYCATVNKHNNCQYHEAPPIITEEPEPKGWFRSISEYMGMGL